MGDWADQQYPVLLRESWDPATYGNFRICWLWTISRVVLLCPFILVMAFPLSAFSSWRTCKYQFHLSLSCKVGTGKLSLCKSVLCRRYFFLQTPMKEQGFWSSFVVGPSSFPCAGNAFMIHIKIEVFSWALWITRDRPERSWVRPPEGCKWHAFRLHQQIFACLDFNALHPTHVGSKHLRFTFELHSYH